MHTLKKLVGHGDRKDDGDQYHNNNHQLLHHHYEDPSKCIASQLSQGQIEHFVHKYDAPQALAATKLRPTKSLDALNTEYATADTVTQLDETELNQIELFFRSHKTFVHVCRCLTNLYFTKTDLINGGRVSSPRSDEWELARTGVPVIVFDKGETKARDRRILQVCLAERGTGFILWRDVVDNLSDYKAHHPCFHTLYLSCDHRKMAGLSFDSSDAAAEFHRQIETLTADPLNIALSIPKRKSFKKEKTKLKKQTSLPKSTRPPKKSEISTPCLFQHVTSVDIDDFDRLYSLLAHVDGNRQPSSPGYHYRTMTNHAPLYRSSAALVTGHGGSSSISSPSPVSSAASSVSSENNSNC